MFLYRDKKYLLLVIWILSFLAIGAVIGNLTQASIDTWYNTLNRSSLTPPNHVFGIVWTILYIMIATSGWSIWCDSQNDDLALTKKIYIIQMIFNWLWSPLFFIFHFTGLSLILLILIVLLVLIVFFKSYSKNKIASFLLLPYLLWLCFAGYLNFYIWQYN